MTESPSRGTAAMRRVAPAAMRRNAIYFAAAKVAAAGLSFAILVLVTRSLTPVQFGVYIVVSSFARFVMGLSMFGIDWAAFRYLPEFHASGSVAALRRLLVTFVGQRAVVLMLLSLVLLVAATPVSALVGSPGAEDTLRLYVVVILVDGIAEFVRANIFPALLRQGYQLVSQFARSAINLTILWVLAAGGQLTLRSVIESEVCGSLVGLAVVAAQLVFLDRQHSRELPPSNAKAMPNVWALLRFGFSQYLNEMIQIIGDGSMVVVIGAHFVGMNGIALFGFSRSLTQQIHRFLPAENLINLMWPKFIMSYSVTRSMAELRRQTMLVMKLSNMILALVVSIFVPFGREIADAISGGKYGDAHGLLLILMVWLFAQSQRVVINAVAGTVERFDALRLPSLAMPLAMVSVLLVLVGLGVGTYSLALGLTAGVAAYFALAWWQLWRLGYRIGFDQRGHNRIVGAALGTIAVGFGMKAMLPHGLTSLAVAVLVAGLVFVAGIRLLRPFDADERQTIERFVGRAVPLL